MVVQRDKKFPGFAFVIIFIAISTAIIVLNNWIQREVEKTTGSTFTSISQLKTPSISTSNKKNLKKDSTVAQEVIRKTWLTPGRDFEESIFYIGEKEIAKQRSSGGVVYEHSGEIPDGKVKFFNYFKNTYGEEHYKNGKKHGLSKTYYPNGQLNLDVDYIDGKILMKREYYNDGAIRFEVNYEDARDYINEKEVGIGKLYYKDGTLKFEWNITNSNKIGFKKSYNRNGELTSEVYYDENGELLIK
jgi:antitoxin component YwqK of YwqJK toxin-antitoxin module